MKNSKEYSQKMKKLYRLLKRKYSKPVKVSYEEPVESLVYGIISESMTEKQSHPAVKRLNDHFIDFNDLRVSLSEEICESMGIDLLDGRKTAFRLTTALRWVFNKYNTVSLEALKKIGKRPAKEALEKIDSISNFVVDYCMLTSLQGHAIPLTDKMMEYLKDDELVHPEADEQEIEGFLTRQIVAKDAYEFYYLLRTASEARRRKKKKAVTKKMTEKKAKKAVKSKKAKSVKKTKKKVKTKKRKK